MNLSLIEREFNASMSSVQEYFFEMFTVNLLGDMSLIILVWDTFHTYFVRTWMGRGLNFVNHLRVSSYHSGILYVYPWKYNVSPPLSSLYDVTCRDNFELMCRSKAVKNCDPDPYLNPTPTCARVPDYSSLLLQPPPPRPWYCFFVVQLIFQ